MKEKSIPFRAPPILEITRFDPKYILYFDGACEPINPGGTSSFGWSLLRYSSEIEVDFGYGVVFRGGPESTNNIAEWAGLRAGLKAMLESSYFGDLIIYGDSQLVINQLNGTWACKKPHLEKYCKICRRLLDKVSKNRFQAKWIPREQNTRCDFLSKLKK